MTATTGDSATGEKLLRKARVGLIALGARAVALQLAVFGANIALARLLVPADFGIFAIVQFALSFFSLFGDVGLAGALVRQPEEPTEEQLSTVFFAQLGMATIIVAIIALGAGEIRVLWPELPPSAPWLMRAVAFDFLLTAFRIIPSVLLERHLEFHKLAIIEVVVSMSFYVTAVTLAALGFGVWSFVVGLGVQGLLSLAAMYSVRPWRPKAVFHRASLLPLLRFGIIYQSTRVIGLVHGAITPIYAGRLLGAGSVGFINWAQTTAYMPLKLVEIMARVNFPLYARLQGDRKLFSDTLGRSIALCAVFTLLLVSIFLGLGPSIIAIVYGAKWAPALPLLYIYSGAISLGFLAPIVGAALEASGKPGIFLRLAIGWTLLNWIVVLTVTLLHPEWGTVGFAAAYSVHVVVGNAAVIVIVRKLIPEVTIWPRIRASILAAIATATLGHWGALPYIRGPVTFVAAIVVCASVFSTVLALVDRSVLQEVVDFLRPKRPVPNVGAS